MAGDGREWVRWRKRTIDKKKHTKRIIIMKLNKRREKMVIRDMVIVKNTWYVILIHIIITICALKYLYCTVHTIRTHPFFPAVCLSSVKLSKVADLFSVVMNLIKYLCWIKTLPLLGRPDNARRRGRKSLTPNIPLKQQANVSVDTYLYIFTFNIYRFQPPTIIVWVTSN